MCVSFVVSFIVYFVFYNMVANLDVSLKELAKAFKRITPLKEQHGWSLWKEKVIMYLEAYGLTWCVGEEPRTWVDGRMVAVRDGVRESKDAREMHHLESWMSDDATGGNRGEERFTGKSVTGKKSVTVETDKSGKKRIPQG